MMVCWQGGRIILKISSRESRSRLVIVKVNVFWLMRKSRLVPMSEVKVALKILWSVSCHLFNMCWKKGIVPDDWCKAVIVSLYKAKVSQKDCKSFRGINLLSVIGKLYANVLIERVIIKIEEKIWKVLEERMYG